MTISVEVLSIIAIKADRMAATDRTLLVISVGKAVGVADRVEVLLRTECKEAPGVWVEMGIALV